MSNDVAIRDIRRSLRRNITAGIVISVCVVAGFGGWTATTELSGAVYAHGTIVVDGYAKRVQHQTGGIVMAVLVREGQLVQAGDVLIRLDGTKVRSSLAAVTNSINQFFARQARLEAERDGNQAIPVPAELKRRLAVPDAVTALASETRLFQSRQEARSGQKAQLAEQQQQLREQITGYILQKEAKEKVIASAEDELKGLKKLLRKGLTSASRVNTLERAIYNLAGERGGLISSIAQARGKIAEIGRQIVQIDQDLRAEVSEELRDTVNQRAELLEQETSLSDELSRIEITAPISGRIHELAVNTVGGVISPAETLMEIVPENEQLTVEARVNPADIDQIFIGQDTYLRLTAFNRNTTPELTGKVLRVSADLETDDATQTSFYRVAVAVPESERTRLSGRTLIPGMPADAFIRTADRSVASYLLKPVTDHMQRVFREE